MSFQAFRELMTRDIMLQASDTSASETQAADFVDRRSYEAGQDTPVRERRQFTNSHDGLSPNARELAVAIDEYKLVHRRRFITFEEMLSVIESLGYAKA